MTTDTQAPSEPEAAPPEKRRRRTGLARKESRLGVTMILPAIIVMLLLVALPLLWNFSLSLQKARLINIQDVKLIGFDATLRNFDRVIGARDFWPVLNTTFVYTIAGTVLSIAMGLWAALTLRKPFPGRWIVRGLVLFPYIVPVIAAAFVWKIMLNPTFGIANVWITSLGGTAVDFLGARSYEVSVLGLFSFTIPLALTTVILFEAWRYFPFAYLFILAAVISLPQDVDEAALVDGATISQRFRYITLPALMPVISVLFLLRFIFTFNKFDDVFLLTGGGAGTEVITVKIVDWLTGRADVGAAAALGVVLAAILLVLMLVYFKWFYKEDDA